jgi:hypothetical protein
MRHSRWNVQNIAAANRHLLRTASRRRAHLPRSRSLRIHRCSPNRQHCLPRFDDYHARPILMHLRFAVLARKVMRVLWLPKSPSISDFATAFSSCAF